MNLSVLKTQFSPYWRIPTYAALGVVLAGAVFIGWLVHTPSGSENNAPVNVWQKAKPAKQVSDVPKLDAPIKSGKVKVYPASVKGALKLPPAIKDDPLQQVIAATHVAADEHPQTVTTTINTDTGETETIIRKEPLPWIAWSDRGGVAMYAGLKSGSPTVRLQVHQELFSIKAVHFGAVASLDQSQNGNQDSFIGIGAEYRW